MQPPITDASTRTHDSSSLHQYQEQSATSSHTLATTTTTTTSSTTTAPRSLFEDDPIDGSISSEATPQHALHHQHDEQQPQQPQQPQQQTRTYAAFNPISASDHVVASAEEQLVDEFTAAGGMRLIPTRAEIASFVNSCYALRDSHVFEALIARLPSSNTSVSWQTRLVCTSSVVASWFELVDC
jgi:hypothetical protein